MSAVDAVAKDPEGHLKAVAQLMLTLAMGKIQLIIRDTDSGEEHIVGDEERQSAFSTASAAVISILASYRKQHKESWGDDADRSALVEEIAEILGHD